MIDQYGVKAVLICTICKQRSQEYVTCRESAGIGNVSGKVEKGMLVLNGKCTHCGGPVARVIENE